MADSDVPIDPDQNGRPDGGRLGDEGERQDVNEDDRMSILEIVHQESGVLNKWTDAVEWKGGDQQKVVDHCDTLTTTTDWPPLE